MKRQKHFFRSAISKTKLVKNLKGHLEKVGEPPGTLLYTGEKPNPTKFSLLKYTQSTVEQSVFTDPDKLFSNVNENEICWINVTGFGDTSKIQAIGEHFNIHPLTLEDVLSVEQRPKFEKHETYIFLTINMLDYKEETEAVNSDHFSVLRTGNTVISFMNQEHNKFNAIIDRIVTKKGVIRTKPASFLVYGLIDTIVDHYYYIINRFNDRISSLETDLLESPKKEDMHEILHYKKQMQLLRKSIDPWKEVNHKLVLLESDSWPNNELVYLNDILDHIKQISGHLDAFSENLRSLTDLYMSIASNKMNEVMKTLTIISTIFIPLTFLAGIYGMNFINMPELQWPNGYYYTLGGMGAIGILTFIYMRTKHWF